VAVDPPVVVSLGDNCLDLYLPPVDRVLVGGSCLNVAVHLSRRGLRAAYIGPVGNDRPGQVTLAELAAQSVDCSHVRIVHGAETALTEIALEGDGERRFVCERYAIHEGYEPSEEDWAFVWDAQHVHASRLPGQLDHLLTLAQGGLSVSYDFSVDQVPAELDGLAIAFVPHEQLPLGADPLEAARHLVERGCDCAVVTLGAAGSAAATHREQATAPAAPLASVVDTCGAGDAFIAAFIVARLAGKSLVSSLADGAGAGAEACSILGAFPQDGVPTLVEQ
jgi:fructoselysine 6-kinase